MSASTLHSESILSSPKNKLRVASQKPDLGNRHVSTFSFKEMRLNNNGEEKRTMISQSLKICTEEKKLK